jgi:hypothetical protein
VSTEMNERDRLAADLELLGIVADPERGPLAGMFSPSPQVTPSAHPAQMTMRWRSRLAAVCAWVRRNRMAHPGVSFPQFKSAAIRRCPGAFNNQSARSRGASVSTGRSS